MTIRCGLSRQGSSTSRRSSARPTWASQWHLKEALSHGVDGVVVLDHLAYFDRLAFRRAGLPVLELGVSNVDPRSWDDARVRATVTAFLEQEVDPVAATRRRREAGLSDE